MTFSPRGLPAPPLFILLFHMFKKRHFHREGYRPLLFFISSKTACSPRELPAPPLFIFLFHIFKHGMFSERVTGPTPFHPLVSYLQKRHFHPEGYRLHLFSSSCFISSKMTFSPRGLLASPVFILLLHFFISQKRHFHREGYRLHPFSPFCFISSKTAFSPGGLPGPPPFSSFCFISSKTTFSPRGLPAPPFFNLLYLILKNGMFTERVTGSTPFHPLVSYLQKRRFHREDPPLFILLLHIFKNDIFTERVTGSTSFHPLVSYLQKRHFHREGYRLHPFSSSCFISSKTTFSPRALPAPPLFIFLFHILKDGIFTERVTGSTPFHPFVSYLQKRRFHREGYRLLLFHIFKNGIFTERVTGSTPFSSSCFISSKTACSPRALPAPPLLYPLVSYLQKRHFHPEGYRLHLFSSFCFIASKTAFSPRGLPAPPLFIVLFHIFKSGVFSERATGSTSFHPLVSFLQRHFHREGDRPPPFHPLVSYLQKTAFSPRGLAAPPLLILFSPRGLPAPPLFILLFHIFKNDIFTERVTGSTPFHPLVSYVQQRRFHREGYRLHPFSSSCFISSKTAFSPRALPAPPLFILLFHIFKNDIFTGRVTASTPFHPLVSYLQKRRFH